MIDEVGCMRMRCQVCGVFMLHDKGRKGCVGQVDKMDR